uniref:Uncharacterized protein n=1 Tax=Meloidogyne enterolobii TaxID=390850 RepID=A0A6V7Y6C9_MELEN|nr:unnamed protein product [Meloidogyne enterolobii]
MNSIGITTKIFQIKNKNNLKKIRKRKKYFNNYILNKTTKNYLIFIFSTIILIERIKEVELFTACQGCSPPCICPGQKGEQGLSWFPRQTRLSWSTWH